MPIQLGHSGLASPLLVYPYERSREVLHRQSRDVAMHPCHGVKMRYTNPVSGGNAFPTIAVFLQLLPKGFVGQTYRSTESSIFCAVEGRGRVVAGDETFDFEPHDIFTVPSWIKYRLEAEDDCVVFSYSDRGAQQTLGVFREEDPSNSAAGH